MKREKSKIHSIAAAPDVITTDLGHLFMFGHQYEKVQQRSFEADALAQSVGVMNKFEPKMTA